MGRSVLWASAAGLTAAILQLLVLVSPTGGLLLAYFSPLPILTVGLSLGSVTALVAALVAAAATTLLTGTGFSAFMALGFGVPAAGLVALSLRRRAASGGAVSWFPADRLLMVTSLATLIVLALALAQGFGHSAGVRGMVSDFVFSVASQLEARGTDLQANTLTRLVALFPGLAAVFWLAMHLINAALAQGIVKRLGRNLRPSPTLSDTRLPRALALLLGASAVAGLLAGGALQYFAQNAVLVLAVPYFIMGLYVASLGLGRLPRLALIPAIVVAAVFMLAIEYGFGQTLFWICVVFALLGLVDQWTRLRDWLAPSASE
ncbi:MAG: DUF2232 domain-containing protein [Alphaproteobacteria bacterium]